MNKLVFYDKKNDILSVHKGFSGNEKFKGNIDIGDIVLDVSTQGRIRGIEIMNASKFIKDFAAEGVLSDIVDAEFRAVIRPSSILVKLFLEFKNVEGRIPAQIAVPLEAPVQRV